MPATMKEVRRLHSQLKEARDSIPDPDESENQTLYPQVQIATKAKQARGFLTQAIVDLAKLFKQLREVEESEEL